MTQNVSYNIRENSKPTESVDIEELIAEIDEKHGIAKSGRRADNGMFSDVAFALELDYGTNHTVKSLGQIMDYYEISKRKMRKDEMVQILIMYEEDPANAEVVERRKRLWSYIDELKEDKYLGKYVIFST
jgi:hypothetical protein